MEEFNEWTITVQEGCDPNLETCDLAETSAQVDQGDMSSFLTMLGLCVLQPMTLLIPLTISNRGFSFLNDPDIGTAVLLFVSAFHSVLVAPVALLQIIFLLFGSTSLDGLLVWLLHTYMPVELVLYVAPYLYGFGNGVADANLESIPVPATFFAVAASIGYVTYGARSNAILYVDPTH